MCSRGIKTLLGFGPKIASSVVAQPEGLRLHENIVYSLFPAHVGMRQYWRDFDSLEPLRRDGKAENLAPYQETELWCSAITTLDSEPLVMWAEIASGPRYISLPAYEFRFSGP